MHSANTYFVFTSHRDKETEMPLIPSVCQKWHNTDRFPQQILSCDTTNDHLGG